MRGDVIGIIGLGLIGGSLAKALHHKAGARIIGMDRDAGVLRQAQSEGVLERGAVLPPDFLTSADAYAILRDCAVVFVCLPVELIPPVVAQVGRVCPGIITDVGSVKSPVMQKVSHPRFIGGHPMAGSERQGYACGSPSLFENAIYVLCPKDEGQDDVTVLSDWITRIGGIPVVMDADEHDRAVAAISHLPHVVAASLVRAALSRQGDRTMQLAAGGFRDITRIASSDADLWAGISQQSRPYLLPLIKQQIMELQGFYTALEQGDTAGLGQFFSGAAHLRDALPERGSGALAAGGSFTVEVSDRPGVLGQIATLLGAHGINIRNMSIRNARQYEGGQLKVWLYDAHLLPQARALVQEAGYDCE